MVYLLFFFFGSSRQIWLLALDRLESRTFETEKFFPWHSLYLIFFLPSSPFVDFISTFPLNVATSFPAVSSVARFYFLIFFISTMDNKSGAEDQKTGYKLMYFNILQSRMIPDELVN